MSHKFRQPSPIQRLQSITARKIRPIRAKYIGAVLLTYDSLRDPAPGGLDPGQGSEWGVDSSLSLQRNCARDHISSRPTAKPVEDWRWRSYNNFALDKAMIAACPIRINHV